MPGLKIIKSIQASLAKWYHREKRDLPWRDTQDPYHILVSEFMLQQTQVKTVIPYFERWMQSFPTLQKLAHSREETVLKHWEGLGYYSRARNLHRAAKIIVKVYKGKVPDTYDTLIQLPGIGRYTAGAILSIAFDQPVPVLDGNVKRVLSRLFVMPGNGVPAAHENRLWEVSAALVPGKRPGDFNQAMMELGATVCLPKKPLCLVCPLQKRCEAQQRGEVDKFPSPKVQTQTKKIEVSAAVITRGGKVYIQQRLHGGLMGGLWEFPGGKLHDGETPEAALIRELQEELGIDTKGSCLAPIGFASHTYDDFHLLMPLYVCRVWKGTIAAREGQELAWVRPLRLTDYPMPPADIPLIPLLRDLL